MNIIFTAVHFATYESSKRLLALEKDEPLVVQLTASGLAGGLSAGMRTPLDAVMTRLQLEGVNSATKYGTNAVVCPSTAVMRGTYIFKKRISHAMQCSSMQLLHVPVMRLTQQRKRKALTSMSQGLVQMQSQIHASICSL